jgi:splicing factor 3B subunit 3
MASEPPPSFFQARPLENLVLVDELDSFAPIIDAKIANVMNSDSPQIFTACGRGGRSTLRMMRHGLQVDELTSAALGFKATGIWSTKLAANGSSPLSRESKYSSL